MAPPELFAARDASLFFHQSVVEGCLNVLGVLAGLNRRYYSTIQFKRLRAVVATLPLAPPDVAGRIERVLAATAERPEAAARELEALVGKTVTLVEAHLPEVETAAVRRDLGQRQRPWTLMPLGEPFAAHDYPEDGRGGGRRAPGGRGGQGGANSA